MVRHPEEVQPPPTEGTPTAPRRPSTASPALSYGQPKARARGGRAGGILIALVSGLAAVALGVWIWRDWQNVDSRPSRVNDAATPIIVELQEKVERLEAENAQLKAAVARHAEARAVATGPSLDVGRGAIETQQPSPAQPVSQELTRIMTVVESVARATETNDSWHRLAWRVTIENHTDRALAFDLVVEFVDAEGFTVDSDREYQLGIRPFERRTYSGDTLVNVPAVLRVRNVRAVAKPR